MSTDEDDSEDVIYVPWEAFSAILTHMYEICDIMQAVLEDMRDAQPALVLVPKKPPEKSH